MTEYWELTAFGDAPDFEKYGHPNADAGRNSTFDVSECPFPVNGGDGNGGGHTHVEWDTKMCCGDFPYRFWFLTTSDGSDDRECCEYEDPALTAEYDFSFNTGAMFHMLRQECCADGVKTIGTCV